MLGLWTSLPLLVDSATQLDAEARDRVVVCGSHGGRYAAALAGQAAVRAIVLNDAGIGLRRAGVAGLDLLETAGIPAATIGHGSARIGDAADALAHGVLSVANAPAQALGCHAGLSARAAAELLAHAPERTAPAVLAAGEARSLLHEGPPPIWALDSASLVTVSDAGSILMLGSHGALVGGDPARALRTDALAAVFNDAGGAGTGRLAALQRRGIAAAVVAADSAEIGDGRSTYFDGEITRVNAQAAAIGATARMPARRFAELAQQHGGGRLGGEH
jgi:hypothetical protein